MGLFLSISCNDIDKLELDKMESKGPVLHPSEAPNDWLLAHIDVETTGLLPGYNEMIDIGIVMTIRRPDDEPLSIPATRSRLSQIWR